TPDLAEVCQYLETMRDQDELYEALHAVFAPDSRPTTAHRYLASLTHLPVESPNKHLLVVTTNYDDAMERAFGEPCDVIYYETPPREPARFVHLPPGGEARVVGPDYDYVFEHPTVLKIHGRAAKKSRTDDSYVVTQSDYIEFLAD